MDNTLLLNNLACLESDKEKFIEIIKFLKIIGYTKKDILDVLGISEHTLKKYLQDSYKIPIQIKKILSFYLKLPSNTWGDNENYLIISDYTPFETLKQDIKIPKHLEQSIIGIHYAYLYNSKKNSIYKEKINILENGTFIYTHTDSITKKETTYSGSLLIQLHLVTLISDVFVISFDIINIHTHNENILALITMVSDADRMATTRRILLSRKIITREEIIKYIGSYSNSSFKVLPKDIL